MSDEEKAPYQKAHAELKAAQAVSTQSGPMAPSKPGPRLQSEVGDSEGNSDDDDDEDDDDFMVPCGKRDKEEAGPSKRGRQRGL